MIATDHRDVRKGSWQWAVQLARLTAWGTTALVTVALFAAGLEEAELRLGLGLVAALAGWVYLFFHEALPRWGSRRPTAWLGTLVTVGFACAFYGLLRGEVAAAQLIFVPVIVVTSLLGYVPEAILTGALATAGYWSVANASGPAPRPLPLAFNAGIFLLSGVVAGLLARELRTHYRGEQHEHRLATAVRYRLLAVLNSIDEAIVFSDRQGIVRVVNTRAGELFQIDPDEPLGEPVVQLLRTIAKKTEDPEDFMELFQQLRDDPELELRIQVEQILPARRRLRLYSGPAFDDDGVLVGRIDVYTDVSENVRRAEEVEELYEQARKTAESYQRGLLPKAVPNLPRLSMVAHYVAAAGRRAVCGDFYDFMTLPDGRVAVVMGDVCGVGPAAANDAALARYTLRSFAPENADPGELLRRVNERTSAHLPSERFIRLMYGALDPERAVLDYANAGHVPPIVYRHKTGEVEWLGEGGLVLGVEEDARYKSGHVELDPGDLLVLYTDGVTEAPRLGQPFGQGRFMDLIKDWGMGTPGELVQAIRRAVEAWTQDGELRDDLALLVCQVVPDAAVDELVRELVLPNEPARIAEIRAFVSAFLLDLRAPVDATSEIMLAVGEAAANATRHGRRAEGRSEVRVRCAAEQGTVSITIADDGGGFDMTKLERTELPDPFASGGRGLFLMRELMDEVKFETSDRGTNVVLRRRV
ncbi:MAG TPA: SpoIIE family protein phosphatase [Actinomycetota bacterium]|nr:SpoIIE family protein phosphatase [Actinomycetota bacterium]